MLLKDKVAIVTGSGRGLGKAIAIALASEGASIGLMSRTAQELKLAASETRLPENKLITFKGDVSNEQDVEEMVNGVLSKFGNIDILVNNAGTVLPIGPVGEVATADWIRNIQINLFGTFLCTNAVLPKMIRNGHGKIINMAGAGEGPCAYLSAYASSKSAIIRFTETLADEVKQYKIDVNAIAPGGVKTKITEQVFKNALGKEREKAKEVLASGGVPPETAANLVKYLASNKSDGLTGKIISAVHDDWRSFGNSGAELSSTDIYTMRRVDQRFPKGIKLPKNFQAIE